MRRRRCGTKIERLTIALPNNLLKIIDDAINNIGFSSRSEAIREAIRDWIVSKHNIYNYIINNNNTHIIANICIYHNPKLIQFEDLVEFGLSIISSSEVEINENKKITMLVVKDNIQKISNYISSIKNYTGVSSARVNVIEIVE